MSSTNIISLVQHAILSHHALQHTPTHITIPPNHTFPHDTPINLDASHTITLLQLYYYVTYGAHVSEYIKHATGQRLSMDVRKIVDKVLNLKGAASDIKPADATQQKAGARTADARDVTVPVPHEAKRRRLNYEQDLDQLLSEHLHDDTLAQQKTEFEQYVTRVSEHGDDAMDDDLEAYREFITLSKRNIQLVQDYYQMQPYRDAFVGHYTLMNGRTCKKIKWGKVLDTYKFVQNDLRWREKYGDDSKIESILKASGAMLAPSAPPAASKKNGAEKVAPQDTMADEFGIDTMGSNLLMNDAPMGSMMDMDTSVAAAPAPDVLAEQNRRKEEEARARQKRLLEQQQQRQQRAPAQIIIVPAAASSALTLYNAKAFFEEGRFMTPEEAKAQNPSKPKNLVVRHKDARGEVHLYQVVDRAQNLSHSDWKRVVAIFTNGKEWEFKHYRFKNPTDLFTKYTGFHMMFDDQPVNTNVQKWPVRVLKISRLKRHLDNPVMKEFWKGIQK